MRFASWLLIVIVYYPLLRQLYVSRWENIDYTHAYFILPISLWLVWRMRDKLRSEAKRPGAKASVSGLLLLVCGLFLLITGTRQDYLFLSALSLIPVLFGMIIFLYGYGLAKALSFPILYLLLLIPPPLGILDGLTLPMRHLNTIAAGKILELLQFPVMRQGLTLYLNNSEIYMGPACSGFRSLITIVSICAAYIYVSGASSRSKFILITSIIPLALIGNLLRVLGICIFAHYWGLEWAEAMHNISGYVIFLILIFSMKALRDQLEPVTQKT